MTMMMKRFGLVILFFLILAVAFYGLGNKDKIDFSPRVSSSVWIGANDYCSNLDIEVVGDLLIEKCDLNKIRVARLQEDRKCNFLIDCLEEENSDLVAVMSVYESLSKSGGSAILLEASKLYLDREGIPLI